MRRCTAAGTSILADLEDEPVDTLLTGAATMPDPPDIEVLEPDDEPLRGEEATL